MEKTTGILVATILLLAGALAPFAGAQGTTATIVGTITDASGGALPGALVTARNADTGLARSVPAGEAGAYRLEFLPIGNYVVEATLDGFKTRASQRHRPARLRHRARGRRRWRSARSPRW